MITYLVATKEAQNSVVGALNVAQGQNRRQEVVFLTKRCMQAICKALYAVARRIKRVKFMLELLAAPSRELKTEMHLYELKKKKFMW